MNRAERRKAAKGMSKERIEVEGIVIHFKNGQYVNLDTSKVMIIDRVTNKPLFEEILEPVPRQVGADNLKDNPDGTISVDDPSKPAGFAQDPPSTVTDLGDGTELVENGNWSGVRPKQDS